MDVVYEVRTENENQSLQRSELIPLIQIATYLEPADLLRLVRTNTWLRSLFLSKTVPPWKQARRFLRIPDCPKDLSEPEYASLVFDDDCHVSLSLSILSDFLTQTM